MEFKGGQTGQISGWLSTHVPNLAPWRDPAPVSMHGILLPTNRATWNQLGIIREPESVVRQLPKTGIEHRPYGLPLRSVIITIQ